MKRGLKILLIGIGILILLWTGLNFLVRSYFTEERLKSIALPKIEELTGRKVELERIQVSIFKGIVAKGISLKERDERKDFLKLEQLILSHRLLPLLKKELVIKKIEILSPTINIVKRKDGKYNFSDIIERKTSSSPRSVDQKSFLIPLAIISERLLIRNAHLSFIDEERELPDLSLFLDAELKGSIGNDGKPRLDSGSISLKELKVTLNEREMKISGKVEATPQILQARLQGQMEKDTIHLTASVKDYLSLPEIRADFHAKTLDLQPLLGLAQVKKESKKPSSKEPQKKKEPYKEGLIQKLRASGQIMIDSAKYQEYRFNHIRMNYRFEKGLFRIEPMELKFLSEGSFRATGSLKGDFHFLMEDPEKTLRGKAIVPLEKGSIQQSRLTDAIASLLGNPALRSIIFDQGLFHFDVKEEKIFLDGWVNSNLIKLSPKGTVDFQQRLNLNVELKVSPELSKNLDRKFKFLRLIEDEKGWKAIPLKIEGTTEKPSVTVVLTEGVLEKGIQKRLKEGVERFFLPLKP